MSSLFDITRPEKSPRPITGLLLTGGGARVAYQAGVLEAIADLRKEAGHAQGPNPFPVVAGTSAGAINGAALACGADDFDAAARRIACMWREVHAEQVYRTDFAALAGRGLHWGLLPGLGQWAAALMYKRPRSLLNNAPLAEFIARHVPLERLPRLMREGHLRALAVTASSYSSSRHVTFFESVVPMEPWVRTQRLAVRGPLTHAHLLASSALPFLFPATELPLAGHSEYFGDGSMRQSAPVSPAIHLGAERIVIIGAGRMKESLEAAAPNTFTGYPSMTQIAGHALSSIFLDALAVDIERMQRINQTLALIPPDARTHSSLRPIELLLISPSQRIDAIAARHVDALPRLMRMLFRSQRAGNGGGDGNGDDGGSAGNQGARDAKGSALASYLLFEAAFTQELIALGRADTLRQRDEVLRFFGWDDTPRPSATSIFRNPIFSE